MKNMQLKIALLGTVAALVLSTTTVWAQSETGTEPQSDQPATEEVPQGEPTSEPDVDAQSVPSAVDDAPEGSVPETAIEEESAPEPEVAPSDTGQEQEEAVHAQDAGHGTPHIENIAFPFDGPFGKYDQAQLQRGLQVYTEVCSACHGLRYVPFRTLTDLGYSEAQVRAYAAQFDVFDPELDDTRAATPTDHFPKSSLENAPDLSMMAKARAGFHGPYGLGINQMFKGMGGPEYITAILTGYTGEEKEQAGTVLYENKFFPGGWIGMNPPLSDELVEYADGHANDAHHLSEDVSAFLMWAAEPKMMARKQLGFMSVFFLGILAVLLYLTNKRIWAPVKHRKEV